MPRILLASDSELLRGQLRSMLADGETSLVEISDGRKIVAIANESKIDLAILDMQMGSMGGVASCLELRLEESGGRLDHIAVLLLLDRRPDVFLARRADVEGFLLKPLDPTRLRRAVEALLAGKTYFDDTNEPDPVLVAESVE